MSEEKKRKKSLIEKKKKKKEIPQTFFEKFMHARRNDKNWKLLGGCYVWYPDEKEGCVVAEVLDRKDATMKGQKFLAVLEDGKQIFIRMEELQPMNPPKDDLCDDLTQMYHLNQFTVFHDIKQRFKQDLIYTWCGYTHCGPILMVCNPYKNLDHSEQVMKQFENKHNVPHIFSLADSAFRKMVKKKSNHSFIFTGVSGAGKTKMIDYVLQHFTFAASGESSKKIGELIQAANKLIDSFGNCTTSRNTNSSNIVKNIEISFSSSAAIVGATFTSYLLNLSQLVRVNPGERNFHIFYQLASDETLMEKFKLKGIDQCEYTKSGVVNVAGINDKQEFSATKNTFAALGFKEQDQEACFATLAAILHLGNIIISTTDSGDLAIQDKTSLVTASELLGISSDILEKAILHPTQQPNQKQAEAFRDALAQAIYTRLFSWLVHGINQSLTAKETVSNFVVLLDIPGFQSSEKNGYEQFHINYANERVEHFLNNFMYKVQQEAYIAANISWKLLKADRDLQPNVDLLEKGILGQLNNQISDTKSLLDALKTANESNSQFTPAKEGETTISVVHYTGPVKYDVSNWISSINAETFTFDELEKSTNPFIKTLFSKTFAQKPLLQRNKEELDKFFNVVETTNPSFVRCFTPNNLQKAGILEPKTIMEQFRQNAIEQGVVISRKGYPSSIPHAEFVDRYWMLTREDLSQEPDPAAKCKYILSAVDFRSLKHYKIGDSKVFLKAGIEARLDEYRAKRIFRIILKIQSLIRGNFARAKHAQLMKQAQEVDSQGSSEQVMFLRQENKKLQQIINLKIQREQQQAEEKAKFEKEIEDLKKQIEELNESSKSINVFKLDMLKYKEQYLAASLAQSELEQKVKSLQEEHTQEIEKLKQELQKSQELNKKAEEMSKKQVEKTPKAKDVKPEQVEKLEAKIATLTKENEDLKSTNKALNKRNRKLLEKIKTLEEIIKLNAQIKDADKLANKLRLQLQRKNEQNRKTAGSIARLEEQENSQRMLKEAQEELERNLKRKTQAEKKNKKGERKDKSDTARQTDTQTENKIPKQNQQNASPQKEQPKQEEPKEVKQSEEQVQETQPEVKQIPKEEEPKQVPQKGKGKQKKHKKKQEPKTQKAEKETKQTQQNEKTSSPAKQEKPIVQVEEPVKTTSPAAEKPEPKKQGKKTKKQKKAEKQQPNNAQPQQVVQQEDVKSEKKENESKEQPKKETSTKQKKQSKKQSKKKKKNEKQSKKTEEKPKIDPQPNQTPKNQTVVPQSEAPVLDISKIQEKPTSSQYISITERHPKKPTPKQHRLAQTARSRNSNNSFKNLTRSNSFHNTHQTPKVQTPKNRITSIYVGNIPFRTNESRLRKIFQEFGHIFSVNIMVDQETKRSRGFGFVRMSPEDAKVAVEKMQGVKLDGRDLIVKIARERTENK